MSDTPQTEAAPKARQPKTQPAPAQAAPPQAQRPRTPNYKNRNDVAFRHEVFIGKPTNCLRNVSYEHMKLNLVKVDHTHIFHSHNNQGKALRKTNTAVGHWHEIIQSVDENNNLVAKCGPALHEVTTLLSSGRTVNKVEPVSYEEEVQSGPDAGKIRKVMDDHTHEFEYIGGEELSPAGIIADLKSQQGEARAMGIVIGQNSIQDLSPAPMSAADGASIT